MSTSHMKTKPNVQLTVRAKSHLCDTKKNVGSENNLCEKKLLVQTPSRHPPVGCGDFKKMFRIFLGRSLSSSVIEL